RESFHKHKNSISMVIKNYSLRNFLAIAPVTVAIRVLISCTPSPELREIMGSPVSSLKAVLWVLRNFRSIWSRHLSVQLYLREVPDEKIQNLMLPSSFYVDLLRLTFVIDKRGIWVHLSCSMQK